MLYNFNFKIKISKKKMKRKILHILIIYKRIE